jgi:hypothetical protein
MWWRKQKQGEKMPLIQDNSYLLDFGKEDVIGYVFNDNNIFANKKHSSIWKDTDNGRVFINISEGRVRKMYLGIRGYETFYGNSITSYFTEMKTISVVKLNDIDNETSMFWWVNKNSNDAFRLSEKLKQKDTSPQNIMEVA